MGNAKKVVAALITAVLLALGTAAPASAAAPDRMTSLLGDRWCC